MPPTGYIPVINLGSPGAYYQPAPPVTQNTPVYSTFTGHQIGYGPIPVGTRNDAPQGHYGYGQNYHTVMYNPANGAHMASRLPGRY